MLCYRCGSHVPDGTETCGTCGQKFALGLKPGPIAGFGTGTRRHRIAVESSPYKTGDVLAGRYEIKDNVGAGPIGWVYKCLDRDIDVDVALKVVSPRFLQAAEERASLVRELRQARKLGHPNIVRVYDDGEDKERLFFTMQHLEGLTLRRIWDLRRQKGQLFALREVEPIVSQIAQALDSAQAVMSHGDLKPDNVIVLPDLLKLTDFGLANALPRAPFMAAQKTGGVHRYLAPEFLHGERINPRADVFSLGVVVGEMLAGAPFEGQGLDLLARQPNLPREVDLAFRKAVSFKPEDRFATTTELALALSEAAGGAAAARLKQAVQSAPGLTPIDRPRPAPAPEALTPPAVTPVATPVAPKAPTPSQPVLPPPMAGDIAHREHTEEVEDEEIQEAAPDEAAKAEPNEPAPADPRAVAAPKGPEPVAPKSPTPAKAGAPKAVTAPPSKAITTPPSKAITAPPPKSITAPPPKAITAPPPAEAKKEPKKKDGKSDPKAKKPEPPPARGKEGLPASMRTDAKAIPTTPVAGPKADNRPKIIAVALVLLIVVVFVFLAIHGHEADTRVSTAPPPTVASAVPAPPPAGPDAGMAAPEVKTASAVVPLPAAAHPIAPPPTSNPPAPVVTTPKPLPHHPPADLGPTEAEKKAAEAARRKADEEAEAARQKAEAERQAKEKEEAEAKEKEKEKEKAAAASAGGDCPHGMKLVPAGTFKFGAPDSDDLKNFGDLDASTRHEGAFCIDILESPGRSGVKPKVNVDFAQAQAACRRDHKRLCREDEWERACKGPDNLRFPYGQKFDAAACNTADSDMVARPVAAAGSHTRCASGFGVYDLAGNVAEWTDSFYEEGSSARVVKGGAADRPDYDTRCAARARKEPQSRSKLLGFRCCADPR